MMDKMGLASLGYFTLGNLGENNLTMKKTLEFAKNIPLTYAMFLKVIPYQGTELYELYSQKYGSFLDNFTKSPNVQIELVGTELSSNQIYDFIEKSYKEFYLRPKQIIKMLSQIRNFSQLRLFIKAGFSYFFSS